MTMRRALLVFVLTWAIFTLSAQGQEPSVEEMKKRADEILSMFNVDARVYIEEVMLLADRLAKDGKLAEAARYYEAGLKHFPLDLDRQLACAEVYMKAGKKDDAVAKARIVAKMAEQDALIVSALKMLGEKVDTEVEPMGKLDGDEFTIVLVPMGEVDVLLLREIRQKVQDQMGIRILVRSIPLKMPKFGRDPLGEFAGRLREDLPNLKEYAPDDFAKTLKRMGIKEADLAQDNAILNFFGSLLRSSGDEAVMLAFQRALADLPSFEKQWDTDDLLKVLREATKTHKQKNLRFVGVTGRDIYSDNYNFLFGSGYLNEIMVMSYRRFTSDFTHETPNRARLLKRAVGQALSSCGKAYGIGSCTDPTCPRAYPNSLGEQDAKSEKLCNKCRKAFDEAFGRKGAPTPAATMPAKD